jgi:predicted membrane protein
MTLSNKQIGGIVAIVFGILVLILPNLVNYLIAIFLIVWGIICFIPSKKKINKKRALPFFCFTHH